MAAASRASLIVAASVGVVESLKDQVGLCRWNYAFRSLSRAAAARGPSGGAAVRPASGGAGYEGGAEGLRRMRELERAEKIVQLICWGPN